MSVVLEHNPRSSVDDELISANLVSAVQDYLATRARHATPPQRSAEAWRRFYGICNIFIRRISASCGVRPADLDDCVQLVWADVLMSLPRLTYDPSRGRFRAWLATLAHSKSVDLLRQRIRHPLFEISSRVGSCMCDSHVTPPEASDRAEQLRLIRRLLLELKRSTSSLSFRIFYRRCIMEQNTEDVAARMGVTPEQVRFRLHRVRQKVRRIVTCDLTTLPICLDSGANGLNIARFSELCATGK